jgi:hypothetical protein
VVSERILSRKQPRKQKGVAMDMSKLTPAPWTCRPSCAGADWGFDVPELEDADYRDSRFGNQADAEFIVLARNAFDVMMRRGWNPCKSSLSGNWRIDMNDGDYFTIPLDATDIEPWEFADPFTALVEADRWYRENVEAR